MRGDFTHGGVGQNESADGTAEVKDLVREGREVVVVDAHAVEPDDGGFRRILRAPRGDHQDVLRIEGLAGGFRRLGGLGGQNRFGLLLLCGLRALSALGAEGPDDFLAGLDVGTADEVDAVGHGCKDAVDDGLAVLVPEALKRFCNGLGLAGKIDDERRMIGRFTKHGRLARQNGGRDEVARDRPHLFAEARHLARTDGKRRFGRDVAARGARSARREDEVAADDVDELAQRFLDLEALVGDEALVHGHRVDDGLPAPGFELGNAAVVIDALAGAVRHGHEAQNQFVFTFARRLHRNRPLA